MKNQRIKLGLDLLPKEQRYFWAVEFTKTPGIYVSVRNEYGNYVPTMYHTRVDARKEAKRWKNATVPVRVRKITIHQGWQNI